MSHEFPETDELVICKVKRVQDYGAFVEVIGYDKEGYIHISQVASRWIKNIRNHIREGQLRVGKVTRIDTHKGLIDISLRSVSKDQERKRMDIWKHSKRAEALMKIAAKKLKADEKEFVSNVFGELEKHYVDVYEAFEEALTEGEAAFEGVEPKWSKALVAVAKENVKIPTTDVKGTLTLQFPSANGIDLIRKAFADINKDISVSYISAPKYMVKMSGKDPKALDKKITENVRKLEAFAKANGGTFGFVKEK